MYACRRAACERKVYESVARDLWPKGARQDHGSRRNVARQTVQTVIKTDGPRRLGKQQWRNDVLWLRRQNAVTMAHESEKKSERNPVRQCVHAERNFSSVNAAGYTNRKRKWPIRETQSWQLICTCVICSSTRSHSAWNRYKATRVDLRTLRQSMSTSFQSDSFWQLRAWRQWCVNVAWQLEKHLSSVSDAGCLRVKQPAAQLTLYRAAVLFDRPLRKKHGSSRLCQPSAVSDATKEACTPIPFDTFAFLPHAHWACGGK